MPVGDDLSHFRLPLVLDASGSNVQVGILDRDGWRSFVIDEKPALESLFTGLRQCLEEVDSPASVIDAILFCEGPGSTLGLRIAATAAKTILRENEPSPALFLYNALDLAALWSISLSILASTALARQTRRSR